MVSKLKALKIKAFITGAIYNVTLLLAMAITAIQLRQMFLHPILVVIPMSLMLISVVCYVLHNYYLFHIDDIRRRLKNKAKTNKRVAE